MATVNRGTYEPDTDQPHGTAPPEYRYVLGMRVDALNYGDSTKRVLEWARAGQSRYVCLANVHMAMEAFDSEEFKEVVNSADLVTPDGRPLVWALRLLGVGEASQVRGADLVAHTAQQAAHRDIPVGMYGASPEVLEAFTRRFREMFPGLEVACQISPPFRKLTPEEDEEFTRQIADSGARILFVGLGCPKQERWMADHREKIPAVMLGVGAAFNFHAGTLREAPHWMQRAGLEWLFRMLMDPRLWRRYAKHNPRFVILLALQLFGIGKFGRKE